MSDLRETIKQKAKTTMEIFDGFNKYPVDFHHEAKWTKLDDVLAELTNYKLIPLEKWQKIVELIKNRVRLGDLRYVNMMKRRAYDELRVCKAFIIDYEKWFEVFEAKVAELKEPSK